MTGTATPHTAPGPAPGPGGRRPPGRVRRLDTTPGSLPRLVCFAHAGAARSVFQPWGSELAGHYAVYAADVRAGGDGGAAPPDWSTLVDQLATELHGVDEPLTVYGHSMGSVVAYEVTRQLRQRGRAVTRLVVSGRDSPGHTPVVERPDEPRALLVWAAHRYGGVPLDILNDPETARLMGERLRRDLRLHERYRPLPGPEPDVELHAVHAVEDPVTSGTGVADWLRYTTGPSTVHTVGGGHFAPLTQLPALLRDLAEEHTR